MANRQDDFDGYCFNCQFPSGRAVAKTINYLIREKCVLYLFRDTMNIVGAVQQYTLFFFKNVFNKNVEAKIDHYFE